VLINELTGFIQVLHVDINIAITNNKYAKRVKKSILEVSKIIVKYLYLVFAYPATQMPPHRREDHVEILTIRNYC
jgi:hypothetical protein